MEQCYHMLIQPSLPYSKSLEANRRQFERFLFSHFGDDDVFIPFLIISRNNYIPEYYNYIVKPGTSEWICTRDAYDLLLNGYSQLKNQLEEILNNDDSQQIIYQTSLVIIFYWSNITLHSKCGISNNGLLELQEPIPSFQDNVNRLKECHISDIKKEVQNYLDNVTSQIEYLIIENKKFLKESTVAINKIKDIQMSEKAERIHDMLLDRRRSDLSRNSRIVVIQYFLEALKPDSTTKDVSIKTRLDPRTARNRCNELAERGFILKTKYKNKDIWKYYPD